MKRKSRLVKSKSLGKRRYDSKAVFLQTAVSILVASIVVYQMNRSSDIVLFMKNIQLFAMAAMAIIIIAILLLIVFLKGREDKNEGTERTDKK